MQIAVISDLHLGPADSTDCFGHRPADFLKFLRFLERRFERIVLLGDIWETLTSRQFGKVRDGLRACREAHPEISRRFEQRPYRYVHGNHDLVTSFTEDAPEELVIEDDGVRVLFTHGHQHDALIRHARRVTEFNVWVGGWVRRLGLASVHDFLSRLDERRLSTGDPSASTFVGWAVETAKMRNADIVVTGHTHNPIFAERDGRVFLNSGSCMDGRFSYAALDTKLGQYEVRQDY